MKYKRHKPIQTVHGFGGNLYMTFLREQTGRTKLHQYAMQIDFKNSQVITPSDCKRKELQ